MWNSFNTADYEGMIAEVIQLPGHEEKTIHAYYSRPLGAGPRPGIVLIPHMPGWDEFLRETARRFTAHGYNVIVPNIYEDFGHGTPVEVSGMARNNGGAKDEDVMGDTQHCIDFLKREINGNGKVGVIGMCSAGRHTFLAACTCEGVDAAIDCWGAGVVPNPERALPGTSINCMEVAKDLSCPLLGIFGNEDFIPTAAEVDILDEELTKLGKDHTFYRYDGAGHGIWYYDKPMYRQEAAMDSWEKAMAFFDEHLK